MVHPKKGTTSFTWNGLACFSWFFLVLLFLNVKGNGKVFTYKGGVIRVHPNPTCEHCGCSCPNAFDLPNHFHFFQGQAMESACKSAQTGFARATIQEAPTRPLFRPGPTCDLDHHQGWLVVTCSGNHQWLVGWSQAAKSSHQRSQSSSSMVRKAQTNANRRFQTVQES